MSSLGPQTPLQIALVEDNKDLRDTIHELLAADGHKIASFESAEDLEESAMISSLDLLVVDLNLPGEDGLSLVFRLKNVMPQLRIIMMTTRSSIAERVRGYEVGADIYLPKPMDIEELRAAVVAVGRRLTQGQELNASDFVLDTRSLQLFGPEKRVQLSAKEVDLLAGIARAPGRKLEHWQLLELLGLEEHESGKSALALRITRLRSKLYSVGCDNNALRSLRSHGYQLCISVYVC